MLNTNYMGEIPEGDKDVYRMLHSSHCAQKNQANHTCQGTISIRHNSIALRCPLCGNCKVSTAPEQEKQT